MKSAEEIIHSIEKLYEYEDAYGMKKISCVRNACRLNERFIEDELAEELKNNGIDAVVDLIETEARKTYDSIDYYVYVVHVTWIENGKIRTDYIITEDV